jgi:hypothetical protein
MPPPLRLYYYGSSVLPHYQCMDQRSHRILGTIQLIFITLALYHYMVDNFSNVLAVLIPFW